MAGPPSLDLSGLTVCVAENRATCEPALRLLVASLARHAPEVTVLLFCPDATPAFAGWLEAFDRCVLNPLSLVDRWSKYDIKPLALRSVLDLGADDVLWIDSDIIVASDFRPWFAALPPATMVVAEEALMDGRDDPDGLRARLWGMAVGRSLPSAANSGVIRVTAAHRPLLEAWQNLLEGEPYRAAQALPWYERPAHMAGDQEVLTALLASVRFADVPLRFLRRGRDIVQFFGTSGYTVRERWRYLRGEPPLFVHSQGFRPWWPEPPPRRGDGGRFRYLYHALSPYTTLARRHRDALERDDWLAPPTRLARLMTTRHPALTGMPLAIVADAARLGRSLMAQLIGARAR